MGTTTLRELFNIGLITREKHAKLQKKIGFPSPTRTGRSRLRTPPGQRRIPIKKLSHYLDYAYAGNGCHCLQTELTFGNDKKAQSALTRPALITGRKRRGPTVIVCPLTAKQQQNTEFFPIKQENWSLLNAFKDHIKDCKASPHHETVHIHALELFGYLNPNTLKEIKHWLKQENTDNDR